MESSFSGLLSRDHQLSIVMKRIAEVFPSAFSNKLQPKSFSLIDNIFNNTPLNEGQLLSDQEEGNPLLEQELARIDLKYHNSNITEEIKNFDDKVTYLLLTDLPSFLEEINKLDKITAEDQKVLCFFLKKLFNSKDLPSLRKIQELAPEIFLQKIRINLEEWNENSIKKRKVKAQGSFFPILLKEKGIKIKDILPNLKGNDFITNPQIDELLKNEKASTIISEMLENTKECDEVILNNIRKYFERNMKNWREKILNIKEIKPQSIRLTFLPRDMEKTRQYIQNRKKKILKNASIELNSSRVSWSKSTSKESLSSKTICKKKRNRN